VYHALSLKPTHEGKTDNLNDREINLNQIEWKQVLLFS
jgi:hypothetical protein